MLINRIGLLIAAGVVCAGAVVAELADTLATPADHPAIGYYNYLQHPPRDVVSELSRKTQQGSVQLRFDNGTGYLRSVLDALHVPVESQVVVFSKTSLQTERIEPHNPRTIFFNDSVAVAWVRGGFIEMASQDPELGVIFHSLAQQPASHPDVQRRDDCLRCHISDISLGVPGMMIRSRYTAPDGMPQLILGGFSTDHRSPLKERWGGWYVTGKIDPGLHLGNMVFPREEGARPAHLDFRGEGYLSPYSDVAALLVFNHQMHMMNLITRMGWDVRAGLHAKRRDLPVLLRQSAKELVDYLLFIDEAPLPAPVESTSGFAAKFAARGPVDSHGRSLRQLDLRTRLLRYPCSYMIYSPAFDSLPAEARSAVYQRMWQVLSGEETGFRYVRLSAADRTAIIGILRETKPGLPAYFR